jgi:CBS-domain-containing membrane protein
MFWEERYSRLLVRYALLRERLKAFTKDGELEHDFDDTASPVVPAVPLPQRWLLSVRRVKWLPHFSTPREYVQKLEAATLHGPKLESAVSGDRLLVAFVGSFVGIAAISVLNQYVKQYGLVGSLGSAGAEATLLYAAPGSLLAQPRNVIVGNVVGAVFGMLCRLIAQDSPQLEWLAEALAVSLTIVVMMLLKSLHPPGGATALVIVQGASVPLLSAQGWRVIAMPVLVMFSIMLVVAILVDNMVKTIRYPTHWL